MYIYIEREREKSSYFVQKYSLVYKNLVYTIKFALQFFALQDT